MRFAFINADGVVVQLIVGDLNEHERAQFLRDYSVLFAAKEIVAVEPEVAVWIGGSYDSDSGAFAPPPIAEPEQLPEEIVNVDAPVE
jgi:hypothetical protein